MAESIAAQAQDGAYYARAFASLVRRTEMYRDAPNLLKPQLLVDAVRNGIDVGSMHALHARLHPERLALVDERLSLTYEQADSRINRVANGLREELGAGRHPVMLCLENRVEYMITWMALFRLGWPAVHASHSATGEELRYLVENSEAEAVIGSAHTADSICEALDYDDHHVTLALWTGDVSGEIEGGVDFDDFLALRSDSFPSKSSKTDFSENVVYTSGTTGRPKGTVRDFSSMGPVEALEIFDRLPVGHHERHLIVSKLYHSAGQAFAVLVSALGGTVYLKGKFDPEDVLKTIHSQGITSMFFVPTMLRRVLDLPEETWGQYPPKEFRFMVSGAAPFPQELRERAIERLGAGKIHDFYGASEMGWVTLINGYEMLERPGSVGRPLKSQMVRIVRKDGSEAKVGEVGLIQVSNDQMMQGYLNNKDATDEIVDDGWITVEDTGYLDSAGYLYVTGRERDMVISGGVNIYPAEIEEVLLRHPSVDEIAVIGIPDEKWGERLEAVVVAHGDDFDADEMTDWAKKQLAGYKVPKDWHLIDEMPRNDVGKILKKDLRARFSEE
jgi:fatty-acyl-CoA synthase